MTLSDSHPTVVKRNGKAGREKEYTYRFSESFLPSANRCPVLIAVAFPPGGIYRAPEPTLSLYERQIAPLVAKAMAGFNSTIFAYGQTGSGELLNGLMWRAKNSVLIGSSPQGKTHTMVCFIWKSPYGVLTRTYRVELARTSVSFHWLSPGSLLLSSK